MRRFAAPLGVLLLPLTSLAQDAASVTVSYLRPTVYANGAPLPASAITGYEFRCSALTNASIQCPTVTAPGGAQQVVMTLTVPPTGGDACFEGRTFAGAGNASAWSAATAARAECKAFPVVPPGPPTEIRVVITISPDGFEWQVRSSTPRLTRVGSVPIGIECGAEVEAPFYQLPAAVLKPTSAYRGGPIIGLCLVPPAG